MADIESRIGCFPALELTDIQIYDPDQRRKGHGRRALGEFLDQAKKLGYTYAIVRIGKRAPDDSLDGNTDFYTKCGWLRFVTPAEFSLRFAYFDLSNLA